MGQGIPASAGRRPGGVGIGSQSLWTGSHRSPGLQHTPWHQVVWQLPASLVALGPLEIIAYRPWLTWARLVGVWGFLRGDKGWHKFARNARPEAGPAAA